MSNQSTIQPPLTGIEINAMKIAHVSIDQFIPENKLPTSYTTKFGTFLSHSVDTDVTSAYPKLGHQPQTTIDMFQMIANQTLQNIRNYLKTNTNGILAMQKATKDPISTQPDEIIKNFIIDLSKMIETDLTLQE